MTNVSKKPVALHNPMSIALGTRSTKGKLVQERDRDSNPTDDTKAVLYWDAEDHQPQFELYI